jgi:hypothetical protein
MYGAFNSLLFDVAIRNFSQKEHIEICVLSITERRDQTAFVDSHIILNEKTHVGIFRILCFWFTQGKRLSNRISNWPTFRKK